MILYIISLILLFSVIGLLFWGAEKAHQYNKLKNQTPKRNAKNGRYAKRKRRN